MEVWDDTPGDEDDMIGLVRHIIKLADLSKDVRHLDQLSSAPGNALLPPARCLLFVPAQPVRPMTSILRVVWHGQYWLGTHSG